jgi:hypothetical protein
MPVTTKAPLGAPTLNRKWRVDVNTGTSETPVWSPLRGMAELTTGKNYTTQDTSDFDSEGYTSQAVTALGWSLESKVNRKVDPTDPTIYDVAQEALRTASDIIGLGNEVEVRFYEYSGASGPAVEAYSGRVSVQYVDDGGGMDALSTATVTLTGCGKRNPITHPADES